MEIVMPYMSGETPEVGDYVKNKWEQPGTVTAVQGSTSGHEQISIRWDDGGLDLLSTSAAEFTLLSRSSGAAGGPDPIAVGRESEQRPLPEGESPSGADRAIQYGVVPPATAKTITGLQLLTA